MTLVHTQGTILLGLAPGLCFREGGFLLHGWGTACPSIRSTFASTDLALTVAGVIAIRH
jgi:hypothetical protein